MSELAIQSLALELQPKCREHQRRAFSRGIVTIIPDDGGARTDAKQIELYGKGRDFAGGQWVVVDRRAVVTWALPEDAPHCHRGAYDLWIVCRRSKDGRMVRATMDARDGWNAAEISEQLMRWGELVGIGQELGLECGAHWRLKDWPHFELPNESWRRLPRVG